MKPTLVILAAGMGSRYGSLKQIEPVDEYGNLIIDYSVHDAIKAGFKRIVCIIKKEIEADFMEVIGNRISKQAELILVYQDINMLPDTHALPQGRIKPWGTAHAILCSKDNIEGPFATINADDYYGKEAFAIMYNFLVKSHKTGSFAMVGYPLENTLTEHGSVARGICDIDSDGYLSDINECLGIYKHEDGGVYENDGKQVVLPKGTIASMNMWGFDSSLLQALESKFPKFLDTEVPNNPKKAEYMIPVVVDELLKQKKASVKVLETHEKWFGVTYKDDMPIARKALKELKNKGVYCEKLWE